MDDNRIATISEKYKRIHQYLDERSRRIWAAAEAQALGRGGINAVRAARGK